MDNGIGDERDTSRNVLWWNGTRSIGRVSSSGSEDSGVFGKKDGGIG
jgi:hypothetical protein